MLEEAATYHFFAERWGWTPRQVDDDVPAWLQTRLPTVAAVTDEIKAEKERAAQQG